MLSPHVRTEAGKNALPAPWSPSPAPFGTFLWRWTVPSSAPNARADPLCHILRAGLCCLSCEVGESGLLERVSACSLTLLLLYRQPGHLVGLLISRDSPVRGGPSYAKGASRRSAGRGWGLGENHTKCYRSCFGSSTTGPRATCIRSTQLITDTTPTPCAPYHRHVPETSPLAKLPKPSSTHAVHGGSLRRRRW